jgi:hypothetical protein
LIKILQYLYYHLYRWLLKKWGKEDDPKHTALLGLASAMLINIISIPFVIEAISGIDLLVYFHMIHKSILIIFTLGFLIVLYFVLISKNRFKDIVAKYKNEPHSLKKGILITWIYIIMSYLILFGSGYIIYLRNN